MEIGTRGVRHSLGARIDDLVPPQWGERRCGDRVSMCSCHVSDSRFRLAVRSVHKEMSRATVTSRRLLFVSSSLSVAAVGKAEGACRERWHGSTRQD